MPHAVERLAVAVEPAERTERARDSRAGGTCAVSVCSRQRPRERPEQHDAREVVVGERRMADVRREQELGVRRAGEVDLARGERAVLERGVDDDVVVAVGERVEPASGHAEPPLLLPVRRPIGDQVGIVGVREDVVAELVEARPRCRPECCSRARGAANQPMSTTRLAVGRLDPGAAEVPLARDRPVEDRRAGRRLDDLEREIASEHGERLADAVAGEAARDREQLSHQGERAPRRRSPASGTVSQSIGISARLTIVGRIARLNIGLRPTTVWGGGR